MLFQHKKNNIDRKLRNKSIKTDKFQLIRKLTKVFLLYWYV